MMNNEQIAFLRTVVKEVRMALANQSMDSTLRVDLQLIDKPVGDLAWRSTIALLNYEKK